MARTVDPAAHAVRREAFLDAAAALVATRGYEAFSVADVLAAVPASKGAFYHYFDSRDDLLVAVVMRMVDAAMAVLRPVIEDPGLTALEKFDGILTGLAGYKSGQRDVILGGMATWMSDANIVVRERWRRASQPRMAELLAAVVAQGVTEGSFTARDPDRTGRVAAALFLVMNEAASTAFVAWHRGETTLDEVVAELTSYGEALERVLGTRPGALRLDRMEAVLREWFDAGGAVVDRADPPGRT